MKNIFQIHIKNNPNKICLTSINVTQNILKKFVFPFENINQYNNRILHVIL